MTDPATPAVDTAAQLQAFRDETLDRFHQLEDTLDELSFAVAARAAESPVSSPAEDSAGADIALLYPSLERWVVGHFARVYLRPLGGAHRWCAQWWDHAEAISRLQALWRSWETLRVQPLGMDTWLRERLDQHLPQLLSPTGPFSSCTPERHVAGKDLPTLPAPTDWWEPPDHPPTESPTAAPQP